MFFEVTLAAARMQSVTARSFQGPVDFDWFEYNPNFQQIGESLQ